LTVAVAHPLIATATATAVVVEAAVEADV